MMIATEKIVKHFNAGALTYDSAGIVQAFVAQRLADFLPTCAPTRVLEVGCGTGLFSQHIFRHYPAATLVLTDISPAMVQQCQARFLEYTNVTFLCADGEQLTSETGFDLIVSSMCLHWFSSLQQSLRQLTRQLLPGGEFIFSLLGDASLPEWSSICNQYQLPIATPRFPTEQMIRDCLPGVEVWRETYRHTYTNLYDYLASLKHIGASAPRNGYVPMTAGQLRRVLRIFTDDVEISYDVIYGRYRV